MISETPLVWASLRGQVITTEPQTEEGCTDEAVLEGSQATRPPWAEKQSPGPVPPGLCSSSALPQP